MPVGRLAEVSRHSPGTTFDPCQSIGDWTPSTAYARGVMRSCPYSFVVQQWSRNRASQTAERHPMSTQVHYRHLESRPGSNYRQLWVKGRYSRAEVGPAQAALCPR